LCDFEELFTS
jgi:hypothetical protein